MGQALTTHLQCFFDTRLVRFKRSCERDIADSQIDFEEKKGSGRFEFRGQSADVSDMLLTPYDEPVGPFLRH
jgi:hypothetical protein